MSNIVNSASSQKPDPFAVKDCALIALATGKRSQNLRELRNELRVIPEACIYYHFWGGLLLPRFEEREYNNDFAGWARHALNDHTLAERLAVVDPTEHPDVDGLRKELLEIVEQRLDEVGHVPWSKSDQQFEFLMSKMVVFDTKMRFNEPEEMMEHITSFPVGGLFYHFIDARRRPPARMDDFSSWVSGFGSEFTPLREKLSDVDPYFTTLSLLREKIASIFTDFFQERRHDS
ncbi:MAG: DUF5752 family protein [Nitrospinota bacterium]|nr:DUF5752 family protein [Nitrospinota bacterium]